MISLILLPVFCVILFYKIYEYLSSRPKNFPPGPPKVPWLGGYFFMLLLDRAHLHRAIDRICQFYKSTVIGFHLGDIPIVVVNDFKNVKKLLNHQDFDGRPVPLMVELRHPNFELHGIFSIESDVWLEQRRFMLRYLRDSGFGRRFEYLEEDNEFQIAQHIDTIKNGPKYPHEKNFFSNGQILLPHAFAPVFGNCIMTVLLNHPIPRENMAEFYKMIETSFEFIRKTDTYGKLYSILPFLAKLFPETSDYKAARNTSIELYQFFEKIINEQEKTFDMDHERHFIDKYLKRIMHAEQNPTEVSYFSYDQLILSCVDFVLPSVVTLSSTITFLLQHICHEPKVQQKIQEEIDSVVGQSRAPTLDDRKNLPYTEACLREIMRFETPLPSGVPHKALVDTEFLGFTIPKGTIVMPALGAAMKDASVWQNANEFHPERFLDEAGKLCLSKDISMPFGNGKRLCAGETFSRNMLFLFITSFLQAFNVQMPDGKNPIEFSDNLTGLIRTTPDHWISVTPR